MRYKSDHSNPHSVFVLSLQIRFQLSGNHLLSERYQNENNTYIAQLWVMGYKQQHCDLININEISRAWREDCQLMASGFVRALNNCGEAKILRIQTLRGQIRPFSDHFTQKGPNSDQVRQNRT